MYEIYKRFEINDSIPIVKENELRTILKNLEIFEKNDKEKYENNINFIDSIPCIKKYINVSNSNIKIYYKRLKKILKYKFLLKKYINNTDLIDIINLKIIRLKIYIFIYEIEKTEKI